MIRIVGPERRAQEHRALHEYFRLRKNVFCDQLQWVQPTSQGLETDAYDEIYNFYILHIDDETGTVTGGVRMMPTTGPTLLHEQWPDLLPDPEDFRSPEIWEATRFCVGDLTKQTRNRNFVNRVTLNLSLAIVDFGRARGISHILGVCERKFFDMTGIYGFEPEIIGMRRDRNGVEYGCGLWSTQAEAGGWSWARSLLGDARPADAAMPN